MAITNKNLKLEALRDAGLSKGTILKNWNNTLKAAVTDTLQKWVSGKSTYEKALTVDATSGLDQISTSYWRSLIKKDGSFAMVDSGVAKPFIVHEGKSYLFDISNGTQKTDWENLQVAIAAKAANLLSIQKQKTSGVKKNSIMEKKVKAAVTTSASKASAAIANLNS